MESAEADKVKSVVSSEEAAASAEAAKVRWVGCFGRERNGQHYRKVPLNFALHLIRRNAASTLLTLT